MSFGSFDNKSENVVSDINVTPLVDVMLVLLIVFMITMPVLTQSIPLELPTSSIEKQSEPKKVMRIAINQSGTYIGEQIVDEQQLKSQLTHQFEEDKDTVIAISADVAVEYRHVVKVLELAQQAGLKKIGFVTESAK
ncbi:ExbD/TolR family protein [Otariodibacter oris]|uniref:Outer membrane transport energization protein ExbD n=1 Tax=Otariodibacter oris TaxID=1032623 RepID=A0A420XHV9_9PAST|nr:biopolymer transporter ExbD [Otariodibacter oris]QGM80994.1 biopolymer transporter ExbD [Otariodibacter oris]RKR76826.1 outer membrane transport energization protein ExbD [Otariodibacter oris]